MTLHCQIKKHSSWPFECFWSFFPLFFQNAGSQLCVNFLVSVPSQIPICGHILSNNSSKCPPPPLSTSLPWHGTHSTDSLTWYTINQVDGRLTAVTLSCENLVCQPMQKADWVSGWLTVGVFLPVPEIPGMVRWSVATSQENPHLSKVCERAHITQKCFSSVVRCWVTASDSSSISLTWRIFSSNCFTLKHPQRCAY